MPRFSDPRRLTGETADRPDLLDLGKKLLGYLSEQRKLSGVTTCSIERRTADGSIVRARFVGNLPVIEIQAAPAGNAPPSPRLDGFIVRPSPTSDQYANPDKNHVLLNAHSKAKTQWAALFDTAPPDNYNLPFNTYGALFPEGIGNYGVIDWRSADESLMVTYHGPVCRYFHGQDGGGFRPYVYFKGQLLLDVTTLAAPLLHGAIAPVVRGACIASVKDVGSCLLLCVGDNTDSTLPEYLLQVPVSSVGRAGATLGESAMLAADAEKASILATHSYSADVFDRGHPWMFNQSGNEARCIRYNATQVLECVLKPDAVTGEWGYTQIATARPLATITTSLAKTVNPEWLTHTGTTSGFTWDDDGTTLSNIQVITGDPVDGSSNVALVTSVASREDWTSSLSHILAAVDFRHDMPVYADIPMTTRVTELAQTRTASGVSTQFDGAKNLVQTAAYSIDFTAYIDESADVSSHSEVTRTSTEHGGSGIRTDWIEVSALTTATLSLVEDGTETSTFHSERDFASLGIGGTTVHHQDAPPWEAAYLDFHDESASGSVTRNYTIQRDNNTQFIAIGALDLRYKLLVYARVTYHSAMDYNLVNTETISDFNSYFFTGLGSTQIIVDRADGVTPVGYAQPIVPAYSRPWASVTTPANIVGVVGATTLFDRDDAWGLHGAATTQSVIEVTGFNLPRGVLLAETGGGVAFDYIARTTLLADHPDAAGTTAYVLPTETSSNDFYEDVPNLQSIGYLMRNSFLGATVTYFDSYGDPDAAPAGSWQVYDGAFCYSMVRFNTPTVSWESAVGNATTGEVSDKTIKELTGATDDQVRFMPVGILTKTAQR